jgi:hypothetical protein
MGQNTSFSASERGGGQTHGEVAQGSHLHFRTGRSGFGGHSRTLAQTSGDAHLAGFFYQRISEQLEERDRPGSPGAPPGSAAA